MAKDRTDLVIGISSKVRRMLTILMSFCCLSVLTFRCDYEQDKLNAKPSDSTSKPALVFHSNPDKWSLGDSVFMSVSFKSLEINGILAVWVT
jgi:hypothetical protein